MTPMQAAAVVGLFHAFVDAGSAYVLFRDLAGFPPETANGLIILYNCIAFAGQVPAGWAADRLRLSQRFAMLGLALVATALLAAPSLPLLAVVVVGVGNALYHVGAGAQVLRASGERSAEGGVFVGPGAVGLFAGIWLGSHAVECRVLLVLLVAAGIPVVMRVLEREPPQDEEAGPARDARWLVIVALAAAGLLTSVVVRSFVGGAANSAWRALDPSLLLWLALAAFLGKALGGIVADRLGWAMTSAVALAVSAPLLSVQLKAPAAAIAGMLLLQSTMPVTLKATHLLMPGRPGLAFGLPCLALVVGALLGIVPVLALRSASALLGFLLVSAALVAVGLRLLERSRQEQRPRSEPLLPSPESLQD
jgi:FSR family fosmidomycin resistance protein-like MFS transporter